MVTDLRPVQNLNYAKHKRIQRQIKKFKKYAKNYQDYENGFGKQAAQGT